MTLTLVALIPGLYSFFVDGTYSDGTNVFPIQSGTTFEVFVGPEPSTALLMGLGLAGLSFRRRRPVAA